MLQREPAFRKLFTSILTQTDHVPGKLILVVRFGDSMDFEYFCTE